MCATLKGLLLAVGVVTSAMGCAQAHQRASTEEPARPPADLTAELRARAVEGKADPGADAMAAARLGRFGLILVGGPRSAVRPPGVMCFTPYQSAPEKAAFFERGDVIGPEESALSGYAAAYNRVLVRQSNYRDADLCRELTPADAALDWRTPLIDRAARTVAGPSRDLHDAARRGGARAVKRFLKTTPVDKLDSLGMSALSWAVARDNQPAVDILLRAGADPLAGDQARGLGALYWAVALGREAAFDRLLGRLTPRVEEQYWGPERTWPADYIAAAVWSNRPAMVRAVRAHPHKPLQPWAVGSPLPGAPSLEVALQDAPPGLANELLARALKEGNRLDLVSLALAHGADPNALVSYETPLSLAATGIPEGSPEAVSLLIKAGADVNLMAHRRRPVWVSVGVMKLNAKQDEFDDRALSIFHRLVASGADLNLPDWQGRPPAWTLLFPYTSAHDTLDASYVTPMLLELLVSNGLNLNAEWKGKRLLGAVEAQAGRESELARSLRRLGAR